MGILAALCLELAISGCASVIAKAAHPVIERVPIPLWTVDVLSAGSPYSGVWATRFGSPDGSYSDTIMTNPSEYLKAGNENWNLEFYSVHLGEELPKATLDRAGWDRDIKKTYELATYMFGATPLPVDAKIYLVSGTKGFVHEWHASSFDGVPVRYAFRYDKEVPGASVVSPDALVQRREGLSNLVYLLQKYELANGVTKGVRNGDDRANALKAEENSLCALLAIRPALAEGMAVKIKSGAQISSTTLAVLKENYNRHDGSESALKMYATAVLFREAGAYMDGLHQNWPKKGTDKLELNSTLRFCRAFVKYQGNVEEQRMPAALADNEPDFFR